jgi:hypothetical protein
MLQFSRRHPLIDEGRPNVTTGRCRPEADIEPCNLFSKFTQFLYAWRDYAPMTGSEKPEHWALKKYSYFVQVGATFARGLRAPCPQPVRIESRPFPCNAKKVWVQGRRYLVVVYQTYFRDGIRRACNRLSDSVELGFR